MRVNSRFLLLFAGGAFAGTIAATMLLFSGVIQLNTAVTSIQIGLGVLMFLAIVFLFWLLLFSINRPFAVAVPRIVEGLRGLSRGNYRVQLPAHAPGELGVMLTKLKAISADLRDTSYQADSIAGRFEQDTVGATDVIDQVQAGVRVQAENAILTMEAIKHLNDGLMDLARSVDNMSRSVQTSSTEMTQMDVATIRVTQMINALAASIEQASTKNREGSQGTKSAAHEIREISGRILGAHHDVKQMMAITKDASFNAQSASETMNRLQKETEGIGEAIEAVINGTNAIHFANEKILTVTESLEQRVDQVDGVIEVIRHMSERTKLLSINASIIASEAGEHGKAFAVVAGEVKELAHSTAGAISEISKIVADLKEGFSQTVETIQTGQSDVDNGVALAREAVVVLRTIPEEVRVAAISAGDMMRSTEQQSSKFKTVEKTIGDASGVLSSMSDSLSTQSNQNDEMTTIFAGLSANSQQLLHSAKEHSGVSSVVARSIGRLSDEAATMSEQLRNKIMGLQDASRLVKDTLDVAKRSKRHADEVAVLVGELYSVAAKARKELGEIN